MAAPQLIRLMIEYDGTGLSGWQRQDGQSTVQGALDQALAQVTPDDQETLDVRCAGRTDAGVHAYGQVVTFCTTSSREPRRFAPALNHHLPLGIRVHRAEAAPAGFSARHHACGKTYRYTLFAGPHPSALLRHRAWHVHRRLCLEAMQLGANQLVGNHDFESFRSVHCDALNARRHLSSLDVAAGESLGMGRTVHITLTGDAFCRHMCRIIVGTLVEVGAGRRQVADLAGVLAARDRTQAGETAPGCGLTLMRVHYQQAWAFAPEEPRRPV